MVDPQIHQPFVFYLPFAMANKFADPKQVKQILRIKIPVISSFKIHCYSSILIYFHIQLLFSFNNKCLRWLSKRTSSLGLNVLKGLQYLIKET